MLLLVVTLLVGWQQRLPHLDGLLGCLDVGLLVRRHIQLAQRHFELEVHQNVSCCVLMCIHCCMMTHCGWGGRGCCSCCCHGARRGKPPG